MSLPAFKYHPDPISTGSLQERKAQCLCCGEARDYIYTGPVYCETTLDEVLCPWCIADGLAHEKYGAEFTDKASVGGYDDSTQNAVPQEVVEEVAYRTPGFNGWQQEHWLVHCADACAYLGPAGKQEIEAYDSQELLESLRTDMDMNQEDFRDYLDGIEKDGSPTAYIFRCLQCGKYLGYSDFD